MSKGTKSIAFYVMIIAVFGSLMYLVVKEGESRQVDHAIRSAQEVAPQNMGEGFLVFWNAVSPVLSWALPCWEICCRNYQPFFSLRIR